MTRPTRKELQDKLEELDKYKDSPYYEMMKGGLEDIIDYATRHGLLDDDDTKLEIE